MAARVKRLEGMVRDMLDTPPPGPPAGKKGRLNGTPELMGQVVQNDHVPTYVGATHCLAMLEDASTSYPRLQGPSYVGNRADAATDPRYQELL